MGGRCDLGRPWSRGLTWGSGPLGEGAGGQGARLLVLGLLVVGGELEGRRLKPAAADTFRGLLLGTYPQGREGPC